MAKRAPAGEVAYNPLDMSLAQSVVKGASAPQERRTSPEGRSGNRNAENQFHGPKGAFSSNQIVGMPNRDNLGAALATGTRSLNREKRVLLTPEEERQVERLVDRMGEQLRTSLKLSHLMRACMAVLCHAETEILHHAEELQPLPRPPNGDAVALAQFEQTLAKLLSKALRDAPPLR